MDGDQLHISKIMQIVVTHTYFIHSLGGAAHASHQKTELLDLSENNGQSASYLLCR